MTNDTNGGKTGHPPGMLQDDSRELSRALASKPDAMLHAREAGAAIAKETALRALTSDAEKLGLYATDGLRAALERINACIKDGPLQGSGCDATAQRNGLILASNIVAEMLTLAATQQPADGMQHMIDGKPVSELEFHKHLHNKFKDLVIAICAATGGSHDWADLPAVVAKLAAQQPASSAPEQPAERTEFVIGMLMSALGGIMTFFGMDEDEASKPTFDAARHAHDYARIVTRPLEPHEREALAHLRRTLHGWHARAVALGADGVDNVLHAAEVAKRRGELRTVDGFVSEWRFPAPEQPSAAVGAADTVTLVGVRADGSEQVLGTATMPPLMKARELVQEQFGAIDEDGCNDAALAMHACELLLEWLDKTKPTLTLTAPPSAPVEAAKLRTSLDVTLDGEAADMLRSMLGEDEGEPPTPIRILVGDGHSGHGLYVAQAEYQSEGSMLLCNTAPPEPLRVGALSDAIEHIAKQWDGCMYEGVGETLDIGKSIRFEAQQFATLSATNTQPTSAAAGVDALAQFIRAVDGRNNMGAGALAEHICEWLATTSGGKQ